MWQIVTGRLFILPIGKGTPSAIGVVTHDLFRGGQEDERHDGERQLQGEDDLAPEDAGEGVGEQDNDQPGPQQGDGEPGPRVGVVDVKGLLEDTGQDTAPGHRRCHHGGGRGRIRERGRAHVLFSL